MLKAIPLQRRHKGNREKSRPLLYTSNGPAATARQRTPRNHRSKWSLNLTELQAFDLIEAAAHATVIGRPLNRFVTIHLDRGDALGRAQEHIGTYLRLVGQWLGYRGVPSTYLWVMEHAPGTGLHVHMLLHVPRIHWRKFQDKQRRWVKAAGLTWSDGVIDNTRIGPRGMDWSVQKHRNTHARQLKGLMLYVLKNVDDAAPVTTVNAAPGQSLATLLGIEPERSTAIYGRRCSMSNNIRLKARTAHMPPVDTLAAPSCAQFDPAVRLKAAGMVTGRQARHSDG